MGTRASISHMVDKKIYYAIVHNDGYTSYVGTILFNFYKNSKKLSELINLKDIRYLGVEPKKGDNVNIGEYALHTDYVENNDSFVIDSNNMNDVYKMAPAYHNQYHYDGGTWYYRSMNNEWQLLSDSEGIEKNLKFNKLLNDSIKDDIEKVLTPYIEIISDATHKQIISCINKLLRKKHNSSK